MIASLLFQVLATTGMGLVAWWLWCDDDAPAPTPAGGDVRPVLIRHPRCRTAVQRRAS